MLDKENGELIWSKNNSAPFNSQIKIFKDKFFIIDFDNTLRCFSLKNGNELWNVKTQNSLIRSQKKLSMVIVDNVIFIIRRLLGTEVYMYKNKSRFLDIFLAKIEDFNHFWPFLHQKKKK